MKWITSGNLEQWTKSPAAKLEFPGLIADLIRATVPDISAMRFPSGDKGQVRGFDGNLESNIGALNIPEGRSYWEFGTENDYKGKCSGVPLKERGIQAFWRRRL